MIVVLASGSHLYTHKFPAASDVYDLRTKAYEHAFVKSRFPTATYIFTDLDRLSYWELELAAHLYAALRDAGCRVLNDPARVLQRFAMLRQLKDTGVNGFDVWRVEDAPEPSRFPVFLRTQSGHRGPLSDLLHDRAELASALAKLTASGVPVRELMIVEYRAEPAEADVFRKLAVFRIGDRMVPALSAHERGWAAKAGQLGVASQGLYDEEFAMIDSNRWGEALRPAFDLAHIDYGRADFGLVGGHPEIYEINTNPNVTAPIPFHPYPVRLESQALANRLYADAMREIDLPTGKTIKLDDALLCKQRRRRWRSLGIPWRGV